MRKAVWFDAYARLEHNGELLGYRFAFGRPMKEYFDMTVSELEDFTDIPSDELENRIVIEGTNLRDMSSYLNKNLIIAFAGSSQARKAIPVKASMEPVHKWQQDVVLHRRGLTTKVPFISPEHGLEIVTIMDNFLYGSNFRNIFSVMSIEEVEFWAQRDGIKFVDGAEGQVILKSSFCIDKISEEEIYRQWDLWCAQYGVKNVTLKINPLKMIYQFAIRFTYCNDPQKDSVAPFTAKMPVFIGKSFHSESTPAYMSSARKKKNTLQKYIFYTVTSDAYCFYKYEDIEATGAKVANTVDFKKKWKDTSTFHFARKVVHNGEVYELDVCRGSNWVEANSAFITMDVINAMKGVYKNTILEDILGEDSCDLPALVCPTTKDGTLSVVKKVDYSVLPVSITELKDSIFDGWVEQVQQWQKWQWRDVMIIKSCTPSIKFEKDSISFNINFTVLV